MADLLLSKLSTAMAGLRLLKPETRYLGEAEELVRRDHGMISFGKSNAVYWLLCVQL